MIYVTHRKNLINRNIAHVCLQMHVNTFLFWHCQNNNTPPALIDIMWLSQYHTTLGHTVMQIMNKLILKRCLVKWSSVEFCRRRGTNTNAGLGPGTGTTQNVGLNLTEVMGHTIRKSTFSLAKWSCSPDECTSFYTNWLYRTLNNMTVLSFQETHYLFLVQRSSLQENVSRRSRLEHYGM